MIDKTPTGWTDEVLIREIRAGGRRRNTAWEYIYKAWRGYYLSPVLAGGGTPEQADEVLGRVVVDVENQILKSDFVLHSTTLKPFFTECLRRAWVRHRQDEKDGDIPDPDPLSLTPSTGLKGSVEQDYILREQMTRADALLDQIGARCKTILLLFAKGYSMREIAETVGFDKEQSAKNEKGKCLEKLLELAGKDFLT